MSAPLYINNIPVGVMRYIRLVTDAMRVVVGTGVVELLMPVMDPDCRLVLESGVVGDQWRILYPPPVGAGHLLSTQLWDVSNVLHPIEDV